MTQARGPRWLLSRLRPKSGLRRRASRRESRSLTWREIRAGGKTVRRLVAIGLLLAVLAVTAGGLTQLRFDTRTETFLPGDSAAMHAVQEKARGFGGDPIVVILESPKPAGLVTEQQQLFSLLALEGRLSKLPDVATVHGPGTVLNQVAASAQGMLAQISGRRDMVRNTAVTEAKKQGKSESAAQQAGQVEAAQFDQRYLPLITKGLPVGLPTLHNTNFARSVVYDQTGKPRAQWHFVVPNRNSVAVLIRPRADLDQAASADLVASVRDQVNHAGLQTSNTTITGVPVVTAGVAQDVQSEFPLLAALVAVAVALRFILVPSRRTWRHRLLPLAAALIGTGLTLAAFGWLHYPLSFGAAALLPLLFGIGSSFPLYIATLANLRRAVVMSGASAVGFASLALSPLPFVAELGLALATGVVLTVGAALVIRKFTGNPHEATDSTSAHVERPGTEVAPAHPRRSAPWVATLAGAAVAAVLGWIALPSVPLQSDPQRLAKGTGELDSARYAEDVLGSSGEISVVLHGHNVLSPAALAWQRQAEDSIVSGYGDQARPVLSPAGLLRFLGDKPTVEQINAATELMPRYLLSAVTRSDRTESVSTFGVKFQDLGAQARLIEGMRVALPSPPPGYRADVVGTPVAADEGYRAISGGRYPSNLAGILAAGVVLFGGLRRRVDAVRAVSASLLATGWGFAAMWALGLSLSPLTVALGALTTVTGCEFVILLADARRRGDAWLRRSVVFVCLTSVIGYLALTVSQLWILREFGFVLIGSVLLSYLAAHLAVRFIGPFSLRSKKKRRLSGAWAGHKHEKSSRRRVAV